MSDDPTILRETCSCGASTEAAIAHRRLQASAEVAHAALATWRREHAHIAPSSTRIPLARRRA